MVMLYLQSKNRRSEIRRMEYLLRRLPRSITSEVEIVGGRNWITGANRVEGKPIRRTISETSMSEGLSDGYGKGLSQNEIYDVTGCYFYRSTLLTTIVALPYHSGRYSQKLQQERSERSIAFTMNQTVKHRGCKQSSK